jgi:hypothetical protein
MYDIEDRTIEEILKNLDKLAADPDELARWTMSIETIARKISKDKTDKIQFEYNPKERIIKFFVEGAESRDNLVRSVDIHLPLIPQSLQGFFSVFKYNLKKVKFDQENLYTS